MEEPENLIKSGGCFEVQISQTWPAKKKRRKKNETNTENAENWFSEKQTESFSLHLQLHYFEQVFSLENDEQTTLCFVLVAVAVGKDPFVWVFWIFRAKQISMVIDDVMNAIRMDEGK